MENLKHKLQGPAFLMYVLYFITTIALVIFWEKGTFLLWLNERHTIYGDTFFKYATYLGDGWLFLILAIIFLLYNYYNLILLAMSALVQTLLTTVGKRFIFNYPRPKAYYENSDVLFNLVEGVNVHSAHSFPSGHTATAFTIATLLICFTKNKLLQVTYMLAAILVAVSRVYLLQHFLMDTIAGSVIGIFSGGTIWWYFTLKKPASLYEKSKLQRGLLFS